MGLSEIAMGYLIESKRKNKPVSKLIDKQNKIKVINFLNVKNKNKNISPSIPHDEKR